MSAYLEKTYHKISFLPRLSFTVHIYAPHKIFYLRSKVSMSSIPRAN